MAFETAADRLAYLTTFGSQATFTVGITNWDAWIIQDNEFVEVNGVEAVAPSLECRVTDLYDPAQPRDGGDHAGAAYRATAVNTFRGGYNIVEVREDGYKMATVILERQ